MSPGCMGMYREMGGCNDVWGQVQITGEHMEAPKVQTESQMYPEADNTPHACQLHLQGAQIYM